MCDAINGGREPNAPGLAPACGFEMRGDVVFGFGGDGLGSGWLRSLAEQVGGAGQRMAGGGDLAGLAAKQKGVENPEFPPRILIAANWKGGGAKACPSYKR